ncbi:MAG: lipid A deacylase LpxR family protein [Deltaproteobacteria bacterium]|nr:lipid A deacylase LpxR family protein [Deltaproteobacteria bacterium]MCW8893000.1 lipid A deacylase LpxR family protein [Deltaproteobacteria bacterium]
MRIIILLLLAIIFVPIPAYSDMNLWTQSFYFENDLLTGTDNDYTNGIKYSLISPDLSPQIPPNRSAKIPRLALDFFHRLPLIKNAPAETGHKVELAFGQNMYTPKDISRFDLIEEDRPYAGYSYLASAYHRKSDDGEGWSQMDTVEIQLGIVGPASLAEAAQKLVHRVRDLQRPNGWEHQLKNEPGLTLAFERKWLYHPSRDRRFCADAITHAGATLGNIMTYLNAGLEVRVGWNIPRSFAVSLIRPAGSTWSTPGRGLSLYLFSAVNGRLVIRDIFLDGNSFRSSHQVDKEPLVADLSTGLTARLERLSLSFAYTQRTREFELQPKHHGFGSLTLTYAF